MQSWIDGYGAIKDFEGALSLYTGAPYVVAVDSCTNALAICLEWQKKCQALAECLAKSDGTNNIEIPKHTYVSVPIQIKRAGFNVTFKDETWSGVYQLKPYHIWDCARRFHKYMFARSFQADTTRYLCVSFHRTKILGHTQGGAILHNNAYFDVFARKMRFDGRTEGVPASQDNIDVLGMHCRMDPGTAAELIAKLSVLPDYNNDLPNSDYPNLSKMDIFK